MIHGLRATVLHPPFPAPCWQWEELGQPTLSTTNPLLCWSQAQKENYRQEKKRATKQLFSALTDPSVVIMADSLKVGRCATHRGSCRTGHLWHLGGESKCHYKAV